MTSVAIEVSGADRISRILGGFAKAMPEQLANRTKQVSFAICDSLRARTRKAPRRIPRREYSAVPYTGPKPHYVTNSRNSRHGLSAGLTLHRWTLTRLVGTSGQHSSDYYVYARLRHNRRGLIVKDLASERRELLRLHGGIQHAGLAKASWGWVKQEIYTGAVTTSSMRRKKDRRDPAAAVSGVFRSTGTEAEAILSNKLDYIAAATPPEAVNAAMNAASRSIEHKIKEEAERLIQRIESGHAGLATFRRLTALRLAAGGVFS